MATRTKTTKTRKVAGHKLTLTEGKMYRASRPMAERGMTKFDVTIECIDGGWSTRLDEADGGDLGYIDKVVVEGLSYDAANKLLTAFNGVECTWGGRVW
jgi:hypothetical protein